ncbi:MAG: biopolymer transporter ExbD [Elusimicrobia bacterium]|nr:biopolymer transporter ExbD [Elusimicrobiota bacterium]
MTRPGEPRKIFAEMNLIPLIDISLILVIIFMILTPTLIQSQITVKLPQSQSGAPPPSETTLQVQISREGVFLIDGDPVKQSRFESELALRLSGASKKNVLVQADKAVSIEKVVFVLDAAKRLGVQKLGIGVLPKDRE